jgi:hypothetical protein
MSTAPHQRDTTRPGDQGSVLVLVLVLMVIGSLMVVPLMSFAIGVSKHNTVLSDKTRRQEAVKAGLRTALADPSALYQHCEGSTTLGSPSIDGIGVSSRCEFLAFSLATAEEDLHLGLAATRVGEQIPDDLSAIIQRDALGQPILDTNGEPLRHVFEPQTDDTAEWLDPVAPHAVSSLSTARRIWLPNLPVQTLNPRSPAGHPMPAGYQACTVYFPGTYSNPLTLAGPVYFASGIYYFENVVTVTADADVVVGMGQNVGCSNDQEAAFYATNAPATHNIAGLGGTFVFGHNAKLVVTNETGSPRIRFNQRYVNDNDLGGKPSFGVSVISVNGRVVAGPDAQGRVEHSELLVPGVNQVPASVVGADDDPENPPVPAGTLNYRASRLTHEPRPPSPPLDVTAIALRTGTTSTSGAARVQWTAPAQLGGMPVTGYTVTASGNGGQSCLSTGPLECIVHGLNGNGTTNYTFTVTATNSIGTSLGSAASAAIAPRSSVSSPSPLVAVPATPVEPTVVRYADDTVLVSWTEPDANNSPITSYTVGSNPALDPDTQPCVFVSPTSCIVRSLPVLDPDDPLDPLDPFSDYVFTVTATNEMGDSITSPPSLTSDLIPTAPGDSPADPVVVPEPPVPAYEPEPIIDIQLPSSNTAVVEIPGYISVPMGIVRIHNPNGLGTNSDDSTIAISGGIVAAGFRVSDGRENDGDGELTVPIGLINPIVQRTFKITTWTTSGLRVQSTAVVQINQNGAYAINSWEVQ